LFQYKFGEVVEVVALQETVVVLVEAEVVHIPKKATLG
jgi:hypothetical protein